MPSHATVSIDDDFPPGETAIALGPANHEAARGVHMIDRIFTEKLRGNDRLDNAVDNRVSQFVVLDVGAMLSRDHDVFDFYRLAVAIFHSDL